LASRDEATEPDTESPSTFNAKALAISPSSQPPIPSATAKSAAGLGTKSGVRDKSKASKASSLDDLTMPGPEACPRLIAKAFLIL
jgi:hypothetical protein